MATINNATTRLAARIMAIDKKPFTALFLVHPVHRSCPWRIDIVAGLNAT
jgi:hypothetical protein